MTDERTGVQKWYAGLPFETDGDETCERCGTIIEEDTTEWYEAHDEEHEHEHHIYDMQVEAEHNVVTCPTCITMLGEQHSSHYPIFS
jgi:hypothetical protein